MYYSHNLRTNLQEWKNRLARANYNQFGHQLKYFLSNLESNPVLAGIISETCIQYRYDDGKLERFVEENLQGSDLSFENEADHAAYSISLIKYLIKQTEGDYNLHQYHFFLGRDFNDTINKIIHETISPLVYFLHDKLDRSNSVIYLLEKYKRRTEWFTKVILCKRYKDAVNNFEQIFEDDLRLFLFDQGIDYPFSTPKSTSGRADIIGAIDTSDPIVIEIKIFDRERGYGKNRIKEGFTQVVKYVNDFNKDFGYLVIFNMDNTEINIKTSVPSNIFPPMISYNNKTFFLIIINVASIKSASKIGSLKAVELTESELIIDAQ